MFQFPGLERDERIPQRIPREMLSKRNKMDGEEDYRILFPISFKNFSSQSTHPNGQLLR